MNDLDNIAEEEIREHDMRCDKNEMSYRSIFYSSSRVHRTSTEISFQYSFLIFNDMFSHFLTNLFREIYFTRQVYVAKWFGEM